MPNPLGELWRALNQVLEALSQAAAAALGFIPWLEHEAYAAYPAPAVLLLAAACILAGVLYFLGAEVSTIAKAGGLVAAAAAVYFLTGSASLTVLSACLLSVPLFPSLASAAISIFTAAVFILGPVI